MRVDLSSLGWDDGFKAEYSPFDRPDQSPGRVARVDRGICSVLTPHGPVRASFGGEVLHRAAADPSAFPCAGDWVAVREWPDDRATIEAVLARRTAVVRATVGKDSGGQVLAANLDTAAVVEPLDPDPDLGRIERLLALAYACGASPLIILTKADLLADPESVAESVALSAPNVPIVIVSAHTGSGLELLASHVRPGRTLGLLGPSGAGKSSLVNAIVGTTVMWTQEQRADGRGRHTTTFRALVPVPGGGAVLDTPGLRQVGMFTSEAGLDDAFDDIRGLAERCRFKRCAHDHEPGCAVLEALASGELAPRRLASWRKLKRELSFATRRREARVTKSEIFRHRRAEQRRRARP